MEKTYKVGLVNKLCPDSEVSYQEVTANNKKEAKGKIWLQGTDWKIVSCDEITKTLSLDEQDKQMFRALNACPENDKFVCFADYCGNGNTNVFPMSYAYKLYDLLQTIDAGFKKASDAYLDIAVSLYSFYRSGMYEFLGYQNVYAFAEDKYELARGTTNNYINIARRFCVRKEAGKDPIPELKQEYAGFMCTHLIVLLSVKENKMEQFLKILLPYLHSVDNISSRNLKAVVKKFNETGEIDLSLCTAVLSGTDKEPAAISLPDAKVSKKSDITALSDAIEKGTLVEFSSVSDLESKANPPVLYEVIKTCLKGGCKIRIVKE